MAFVFNRLSRINDASFIREAVVYLTNFVADAYISSTVEFTIFNRTVLQCLSDHGENQTVHVNIIAGL